MILALDLVNSFRRLLAASSVERNRCRRPDGARREPAKEVVFVGERLWDEGLESHAEPGNRRGILLDAVHYRQALPTQIQAQAVRERHLDRLALKHMDTFDDFNVETGYVTSAGDSERFRDFIEKLIRCTEDSVEPAVCGPRA
jgi:hypothetical protein